MNSARSSEMPPHARRPAARRVVPGIDARIRAAGAVRLAGGRRRLRGDRGPAEVLAGLRSGDEAYFLELIRGTVETAEALRAHWAGAIDRPLADLSPIEHSILLIGTYELAHRPEVPYRSSSTSVELAKDSAPRKAFVT